jgi:hypothetical protein
MQRLTTDKIDDKSWVMGVLEPVVLLFALAIIAALAGLLW